MSRVKTLESVIAGILGSVDAYALFVYEENVRRKYSAVQRYGPGAPLESTLAWVWFRCQLMKSFFE